jgi:hypothetical protein
LAAHPARMDVAGRGVCQHGIGSVRIESFAGAALAGYIASRALAG